MMRAQETMANIKSSQKANRQRITRTARNVAQKTAMRTAIKRLRAAKTAKDAQALLKSAVRGDRSGRVERRDQEGDGLALGLPLDPRRRPPEVAPEERLRLPVCGERLVRGSLGGALGELSAPAATAPARARRARS